MVDEVEVDLEHPLAEGYGRRRQAARSDGERDVPPLVEERRELEFDLTDDLRPHVQCGEARLPLGIWQRRPHVIVVCSWSLLERHAAILRPTRPDPSRSVTGDGDSQERRAKRQCPQADEAWAALSLGQRRGNGKRIARVARGAGEQPLLEGTRVARAGGSK